jgi:putative NADH-flavin reductase
MNLNIAVIGPTGLTGSHVVVELLNRGHSVTGLSRNPESIGTHPRYKPVSLNVFDATTEQFADALRDHDVVIW